MINQTDQAQRTYKPRWSRWHWLLLYMGLAIVGVSIALAFALMGFHFNIGSVLGAPWWAGVGTLLGVLISLLAYLRQLRTSPVEGRPLPSPMPVPTTDPGPIRRTPFIMPAVPPGFVNRVQIIEQVSEVLSDQDDLHAVAIQGLGGMGKSALAAKTATEVHKRQVFPGGISWHPCNELTGPEGWSRLLDDITMRFGGRSVAPQASLQEKEVAATTLLAGTRALLVLDNIEELFPLDRALPILTVRGQESVGPKLLITTRQHVVNALVRSFSLEELVVEDGVALFIERAAQALRTIRAAERSGVERICSAVGYLPLGIELAAAVAAEQRQPLEVLATQLESGDPTVEESDPFQRLTTTFHASYDPLTDSQRLTFAALSLFSGADFAEEAARSVANAATKETAGRDAGAALLDALVKRSLVQRFAAENEDGAGYEEVRLHMHPLLKQFATGRLAETGTREREQVSRALVAYFRDWTMQHAGQDVALRRDYLNLIGVIDLAHQLKDWSAVSDICVTLARYWYVRGLWLEGSTYLHTGLEAARTLGDLQAEGLLLYHLGRITGELGRPTEAERLLQQGLELQQRIGDQCGEASTRRELGRLEDNKGGREHWERAYEYFHGSLKLTRECRDRPGEGSSLHELGVVSIHLGRWDEGLRWLDEALDVRRAAHDRLGEGRTDHQFGRLYNRRADWYDSQDQRESARRDRHEAAIWLKQALVIAQEFLDQRGIARTLRELGRLDMMQGVPEEARMRFEESVSIQRRIGDRLGEARTLREIAHLEEKLGHLDRARAYYTEALERFTEVDAGHDQQASRAWLDAHP